MPPILLKIIALCPPSTIKYTMKQEEGELVHSWPKHAVKLKKTCTVQFSVLYNFSVQSSVQQPGTSGFCYRASESSS